MLLKSVFSLALLVETILAGPSRFPKYPVDLKFDELPDPRKVWAGAPGSREEGLGRLVLLTDDLVRTTAAQQIQTGQRVGLNWELTKLEYPSFGREPFQHRFVPILGGDAIDDLYTMNPQQSSQWDGLRHWSMVEDEDSDRRVFYGGTTKEEIMNGTTDRIGINYWAQEGINGRGVLIDYVSWAEEQGIEYDAFSTHPIPLKDILHIAEISNITFQRGDILLVRSGMTKMWEQEMDLAAKIAYSKSPQPRHVGVEATMDVVQWLWDAGFAAVAGDSVSFEVWPPSGEFSLHDYILAAWGMPLGEMFDLERLADVCKEKNRWTFFFTSAPFNMPGGVSSPPNAQAIF
ncbi:unnamed protein product [Clonostachys byssicola]|uniref:Cyclase n=1 Tax=Clonostachys byssicola TaxID=160290 RepID=A0A9N9Y086_9HYPO|nr:unnamed protein product [Clonostachys byssicola]